MDRPSSIAAFKDARFLEQAAEAGNLTGRGVERLHERLPAVGIEAETGSIREGFISTHQGAFQHEFADCPARGLSGSLKLVLGFMRKPKVKLGGSCRSSRHDNVSSSISRS